MTPLRPAALLALVLALCGAARPAPANELQYRAINQNLEEARSLVGKARFEQALEELSLAEGLPGNTNRHTADIAMLRATALLGLPPSPERRQQAVEALVVLLHVDPEGSSLARASDEARALAQQLKAERALILHDRLVTVRTGRPLRLRVRLTGARFGEVQLFARYRLEPEASGPGSVQQLAALTDPEEYVKVPLEPAGAASFEAFLRPGVGGVPAEGDHVLRYYLEAIGPGGALLDSNGTAVAPIRVQLSATRTEGAGLGGADSVVALDEGGKPAHPPPPPPPPPPWYKDWRILGGAGAGLVVVGVVAAIVLTPKPLPPAGSLGTVTLP